MLLRRNLKGTQFWWANTYCARMQRTHSHATVPVNPGLAIPSTSPPYLWTHHHQYFVLIQKTKLRGIYNEIPKTHLRVAAANTSRTRNKSADPNIQKSDTCQRGSWWTNALISLMPAGAIALIYGTRTQQSLPSTSVSEHITTANLGVVETTAFDQSALWYRRKPCILMFWIGLHSIRTKKSVQMVIKKSCTCMDNENFLHGLICRNRSRQCVEAAKIRPLQMVLWSTLISYMTCTYRYRSQ